MNKLPVSLAMITYNEADNIARCLDSVPFVAEKIVVDCGSDDGTVEIAQAHGATVVHQPWLGFGKQRIFATTQCSHDWVLVLDADEYLSPELAQELQTRLPAIMASKAVVGVLPRRTLYMGRPMRWYRPMVGERCERLFHRQHARWRDASVHESLQWEGPTVDLRHPIVHHELKLLRYAELKMLERHQRGRRVKLWSAPLVYLFTFFKDYVLRLAMLDGARGYALAHSVASYAVYKRLRLYEMQVNPASIKLAKRHLIEHRLEHESQADD